MAYFSMQTPNYNFSVKTFYTLKARDKNCADFVNIFIIQLVQRNNSCMCSHTSVSCWQKGDFNSSFKYVKWISSHGQFWYSLKKWFDNLSLFILSKIFNQDEQSLYHRYLEDVQLFVFESITSSAISTLSCKIISSISFRGIFL